MIIIFYEMIIIPFRISFEDYSFFDNVELSFSTIFLVDIILNFNTAILRKGNLINFN